VLDLLPVFDCLPVEFACSSFMPPLRESTPSERRRHFGLLRS
jgi:hypothetical protein